MSLLQPTDSIARVVSVFSNHNLQFKKYGPLLRNSDPHYWPVIVLFFIFCLYVYIYIVSPKKTLQVFISVYSNQASKQLYREDYRLAKRTSVFLTTGFILTAAFLIYIINNYFGLILQGQYSLQQYAFFVGVLIFMYTLKFIVNFLLANATLTRALNSEYVFNVFVFFQTLGVVLLPLAICIQFSKFAKEWFLYPALIIFALFYILRLFRGFIISVIEQNVGIVYIFLYFCALEILPLLVLIKFLLVNF